MRKTAEDHPLLIAAMILLAALNCVMYAALYGANQAARQLQDVASVEGTYGSLPMDMPGPVIYYVFDKGAYTLCRQGEQPMETGVYAQEGETVTLSGEAGTRPLLIKGQALYEFDRERGQWVRYVRHSGRPYYITPVEPSE